MIKELLTYTPVDVWDMDRLMKELSATSYCNETILDNIIGDSNSHLYVIRTDDRIVGCACLCVVHTPEFTLGLIESVTVIPSCRGKGYGRMLMEFLIAEAKQYGVQHLHLTSNPRRVSANCLYQALGFIRYDTNCYKKDI